MSKQSRRPFGLRGVPNFQKSERFPSNPHSMSNAELESAWETFLRDTNQPTPAKDKEYWDHVSRMEFELKKRGI